MELPRARSNQTALAVAVKAARAAGEISRERFGSALQINHKGRNNIVTDVDCLSEEAILKILRREFPDHGILAEESGKSDGDTPYTWIIDPLDGTNNYLFGLPFYSVSIALMQENDIFLGVVYDPLRDELFSSVKGSGAWMNDKRISVTVETKMANSFIGSDVGYDSVEGKRMLDTLGMLWPRTHGVRIVGSAVLGLAYVACGRVSLYIHRNLYPWDMAAGTLLVREAGGVVTDWKGRDVGMQTKQIAAANMMLNKEFVELVTQ